MGSDFFVSTWGVRGRNWNERRKRASKLLDEAEKAIRILKPSQLDSEFKDRWCPQANDDNTVRDYDAEVRDGNIVTVPDWFKEARRILLDDVEQVGTAVQDQHREAVWIWGGGNMGVLTTGGMSSGDSPTDLMDSLDRLKCTVLIDDRSERRSKRRRRKRNRG